MTLPQLMRPRSMGGWFRLLVYFVELPWVLAIGLLHVFAGLGWVATVLLMLALPLGLHLRFVRGTFKGARVHGIHAAPLTRLQRLGLFWGEVLAVLRMFSWLIPWRGNVRIDGQGIPVVCVHGFICSGAVWWPLARWLRRRGQGPVVSLSLYPPFESIELYSERLAQAVEQLCAQTGADKVHLIGHSMGGLVIRNYIRLYGSAAVQSVVTLGSPHCGTIVRREQLKLGENVGQMRIGSHWIKRLNADDSQAYPVPITSIWSPHDNIVLPQDTSVLGYPNARNIKLVGLGHDALLFSRRAWQQVQQALERHS